MPNYYHNGESMIAHDGDLVPISQHPDYTQRRDAATTSEAVLAATEQVSLTGEMVPGYVMADTPYRGPADEEARDAVLDATDQSALQDWYDAQH